MIQWGARVPYNILTETDTPMTLVTLNKSVHTKPTPRSDRQIFVPYIS